jgi:hypothetical protein
MSEQKSKTVFDHLNHIRSVQSKDYFKKLTDEDLKTFNKFVILKGLSMDANSICNISYISPIALNLPNENFYFLCCLVVSKTKQFFPWVKSTGKKFDTELVNIVKSYFNVSIHEANTYCREFFSSEQGVAELRSLLQKTGLEEKEISKLIKN